MVGGGRAGRPEVLDTHRPEGWRMTPFEEREGAGDGQAGGGRAALVRVGLPLRRLRPPAPVTVVCAPETRAPLEVSGGPFGGAVRSAHGPWLHSGEWWEDGACWSREEWDVELGDGTLARLVRQRGAWTVEGVY
jgi:hypothetical protein